MDTLICLILISIFIQNIFANIIENGDFESGHLNPWHCRGSQCHIVDGVLGKNTCNVDNAIYISYFPNAEVTERTHDWAGVFQDLRLNSFIEEPLQYWFNFSIQVNQRVFRKKSNLLN